MNSLLIMRSIVLTTSGLFFYTLLFEQIPLGRVVIIYVLSLFALVLFAYAISQLIIKRKLKIKIEEKRIREEERAEIRKKMARDFHDNMGNRLASITAFSRLISLKLKDGDSELYELIENIEKHTVHLFNGTKDFIWSIDPKSDKLEEVFFYLKDFGEELFDQTGIAFYSEIETTQDHSKEFLLPFGVNRQIILIGKEAMTNILKHSGASRALLRLEYNENEYKFSFIDNGDTAQDKEFTGSGLINMQQRADEAGIQWEMNTQKDSFQISIKGNFNFKKVEKLNKV